MSTQRAAILAYLEEHGSITRAEAMSKLGIMELTPRLSELERIGFEFDRFTIQRRNRYGRTVRLCEYRIASYPAEWQR